MTAIRGLLSRTLLDHSVPRGLRAFVTGFDVKHAFEMGWHELRNGDLLAAAEQAGFAIVITANKNIRYEQSRAGRRIAIVQLSTNHWPTLERHGARVLEALQGISVGAFIEVAMPRPMLRRRPPPVAGNG
jgi:hypothetical protein